MRVRIKDINDAKADLTVSFSTCLFLDMTFNGSFYGQDFQVVSK